MVESATRYRIHVRGTVQGVGFRPFVYRLAHDEGLAGWVRNDSSGVVIEVEGAKGRLDRFLERLPREAPAIADIAEVRHEAIPASGDAAFAIVPSERLPDALAEIPADLGICDDCRRELLDPADRRYLYPFINCTNCGPRFTIAECLPYDRPFTSMKVFAMCPACQAEYDDPANRRFHAQPNACWECGPRLTLLDASGQPVATDDPLGTLAAALREGKIAAVKGLGGFHLAADATNEEAVQTLRLRKWREKKPFAVMVPDLDAAQRLCELSEAEARLLGDYRKPIVLARKRAEGPLAHAVAPASPFFGLMLPYTPVHVLLMSRRGARVPASGDCGMRIAECGMRDPRPIDPTPSRSSEFPVPHSALRTPHSDGFAALVMTSANRTDEPIAVDNEEALARLSRVADVFLVHDRAIIRRSDDSVTRVFRGEPLVQRRARGYVPRAIPIQSPVLNPNTEHRTPNTPVLALGGDLKNTVCIIRRGRAYLSQHIGDLEHADALAFFEETIAHFESILETRPTLIAHDLHPGYHSTAFARRLAAAQLPIADCRVPISTPDPEHLTPDTRRLVGVQHHHAHAVSCMAEHGLEGPVIGVSLDGTGYGTDGKVWGGEFLVATLTDFERLAHLAYVPMPGGEQAIKEPWRMAIAYLGEAVPELAGHGIEPERLAAVEQLVRRRIACPETSSMGRLFDAVSALLGVCTRVSYEGQAAIELEAAASIAECRLPSADCESENRDSETGSYPFSLDAATVPWTIDPCEVVRAVLRDARAAVPRGRIGDRFHDTIVEMVRTICHRARQERGLETVVLGGGCFQNLLLLERTSRLLGADGFDVRYPRLVPTNDGGLSLGQAVVALARARMTNDE